MRLTMALDEALRPMTVECGNCGGKLIVYPAPIPKGTGFCSNCSPAWLESFAQYMMNAERTKRGLSAI